MPTIREWLTKAGFDWDAGKIVVGLTEGSYPGWDTPSAAEQIDSNHTILDHVFDDDFGGAECPRFICSDQNFVYFAGEYDGSQWLEKVAKDAVHYLDHPNDMPA